MVLSNNEFDFVVIGAGITGAVVAEQAANNGFKVLVIDKRNHIAGNCYDARNDSDYFYHVYGPHIFHTNLQNVVSYLSQFTDWYDYEHRAMGLVDGRLIPIPFNLTSLKICFDNKKADKLKKLLINLYGYGTKISILQMKNTENADLKKLADYIYNKIFLSYTVKQWGMSPEELLPSVSSRVPVHISYDDRYFQDSFQKMPHKGYTNMVQHILGHKNITLLLNTKWCDVKNKFKYGKLVYTGTIDGFYDYKFGKLQYRSLFFDFHEYAIPLNQPVGTVNYPNDHKYTRITEMSHLTRDFKRNTLVSIEYPQDYDVKINEPYYPVPCQVSIDLYNRYMNLANEENPDTIFAGRLGEYKYYNMDQAIARALELSSDLLQ